MLPNLGHLKENLDESLTLDSWVEEEIEEEEEIGGAMDEYNDSPSSLGWEDEVVFISISFSSSFNWAEEEG